MEFMEENSSQKTFLWPRRLLFMCGILIFICGYLLSGKDRVKMTINQNDECVKIDNKGSFRLGSESVQPSVSTSSCHFVVRNKFEGRVGNQMFQVAATIGIAYNLDMIPLINLKDCSIAKYFDFPKTVTSCISADTVCNEIGSQIYSNCSKKCMDGKLQNIEITGYRHSWKYFSEAEAFVRDVFQFKSRYVDEARLFIANTSKSGYDNVCIHVRRGDFLHSNEQAVGRVVADTVFLSKAMQFFNRKLTNVQFIVLSDDIKWCKVNIKGNVAFSPYKDPGVDLAIMSLCDHVIVTSGSFGWWGAWLSNGTIVYYHGFPRNGSKMYQSFNSADYYPPHWIKL